MALPLRKQIFFAASQSSSYGFVNYRTNQTLVIGNFCSFPKQFLCFCLFQDQPEPGDREVSGPHPGLGERGAHGPEQGSS